MIDEKITFEDAVKELEETVKTMENGELGLDGLLEQYEKGIHLLRCCEAKLAEAEGKIEVLTKKEIQSKATHQKIEDALVEEEEISMPEEPFFDENSLF
ncbi:MAG: exodeoxyribonuclease VII small subunit [Bacillota bacterium]|nr:exodeoxyribonuclease VII small subunit [Bacillota bacterium]